MKNIPAAETYRESTDSHSPDAGLFRYFMSKGEILNLAKTSCGCTIRCLSGIAWLTREHDLKDYILMKDSVMDLNTSALIVIEALTDAAIEIAGNMPHSDIITLTCKNNKLTHGSALFIFAPTEEGAA